MSPRNGPVGESDDTSASSDLTTAGLLEGPAEAPAIAELEVCAGSGCSLGALLFFTTASTMRDCIFDPCRSLLTSAIAPLTGLSLLLPWC